MTLLAKKDKVKEKLENKVDQSKFDGLLIATKKKDEK